MAADIKIVEEANKPLGMHPKKFALWLFMATVVMIFAALTSAYLVRNAEGNWMEFQLPSLFWITSILIVASSGTMHWAYVSAKADNLAKMKALLVITLILGIAFLIGQWYGWVEMVSQDIYLASAEASGVSGSFVYVISGLHAVHIISALIFLIVVLILSFRYQVHGKKLTRLEMCMTYWHFLGVLWLYLFGFFLLNP